MYVLGYRTCEDGIHTIREERFCDGSHFRGCRDESDEMFIVCDGFGFIGCSPGYFQCALDNLCVSNELICDGTFNCKANLTDEDFSVVLNGSATQASLNCQVTTHIITR